MQTANRRQRRLKGPCSMARIRSIKPEFFTSLTVADLPLSARLTFIGLWTYVDDNGVGLDEPRLVRAAVWPLDDRTAADVEADLEALRSAGLVLRYEAGGRPLLAVKNWEEHQKVSHPRKPRYPAPREGVQPDGTPPDQPTPPVPEDSGNPPEDVQSSPETLRPEQGAGSREQGAGKGEGRAGARETFPPPSLPAGRPDGLPPTAPIDDDGFRLNDSMRRWAIDTFGPGLDLDYETAQFIDHFRAAGQRRPNWPAEWQKWIRRSAKYASERANRPPLRAVSGDFQPYQQPPASAYANDQGF